MYTIKDPLLYDAVGSYLKILLISQCHKSMLDYKYVVSDFSHRQMSVGLGPGRAALVSVLASNPTCCLR